MPGYSIAQFSGASLYLVDYKSVHNERRTKVGADIWRAISKVQTKSAKMDLVCLFLQPSFDQIPLSFQFINQEILKDAYARCRSQINMG